MKLYLQKVLRKNVHGHVIYNNQSQDEHFLEDGYITCGTFVQQKIVQSQKEHTTDPCNSTEEHQTTSPRKETEPRKVSTPWLHLHEIL